MPDLGDSASIRVLIVDDHAMFAESVARLLDHEPDITVVGVASDSRSGVVAARCTQPDVAIVDYGLPDGEGTQTAGEIRFASPGTRVLLLTGQPDDGVATVAIQAGCSGFLTKDHAGHELVTATRVVHSGQAFIPPSHLADLHRGLATQRIRSEFLSRIGHEFRTPLTGILGYGRLLAQRSPSPVDARRMGAHIVESGERLQRIVEILEFTASAACGQPVVRPEITRTSDLLAAAGLRWTPRVGSDHSLRVGSHSALDVCGDPRWLGMALDELVDNAIKFSPGGGIVTIAATDLDVDGVTMAEISVSDEGIGMAPSAREFAFEEFAQLDSSDTRAFGGLGLGLSLVRDVAKAHHGSACCAPGIPSGTRVAFRLPAYEHDPAVS